MNSVKKNLNTSLFLVDLSNLFPARTGGKYDGILSPVFKDKLYSILESLCKVLGFVMMFI